MDGQLNDFEYEALVYQAIDRRIMMFRIIKSINLTITAIEVPIEI